MTAIQSFVIKLAMLGATVALVLWIGWPMQGPYFEPEQIASDASSRISQVSTPGQPSVHNPAPPEATAAKRASRLDINRATMEELTHLPGIGEVLARRVIERRTARGPFQSVDELREVTGIGDKRLEQLRPLVVAGSPTVSAKGRGGL